MIYFYMKLKTVASVFLLNLALADLCFTDFAARAVYIRLCGIPLGPSAITYVRSLPAVFASTSTQQFHSHV